MRKEARQPIRPDIDSILRQAYPKGMMAPAFDIQTSHLAEVLPRLKARLLELDGTAVAFERDPLGGAGWSVGEGRLPSGPGDDTDHSEHPASYYLFFLAATAESCRVGDGKTLKVGYSVALSVMAPLALIVLNHMEEDDDRFSHSVPDIFTEAVEDAHGDPMEIDLFCRKTLPPAGLAALETVREKITATLAEHGFQVLPEDEQGKPIPWLEVPALPFANPARLSVRDALFFWAMSAG